MKMEYAINELSKMANISSRTLRYYDEIGILKPAYTNPSGYRVYSQIEVDRLQQILFYRELGLNLMKIKEIILSPAFDILNALYEHKVQIISKKEQLDILLQNVNDTIDSLEGRKQMEDSEKFLGFKKKMAQENEEKYGKEIREKYGEKVVEESNEKVLNMPKEKFDELNKIQNEFANVLKEAVVTGDPSSELAQKAVDLHRQWLGFFWPSYSKEAHANMAQMYVDDERFTAYYEKIEKGAAKFLRDAVFIYAGKK